MKLIAVHKIGIGKPEESGALSFVEPGKMFEIDDAEGHALVENGAAKHPPKADDIVDLRSDSPVVETVKVDDIASPDPAPRDEEAEFEVLKAQAEALGLKIRRGTKPETIREKIREAQEAAAADVGTQSDAEEGEDLL